MLESCVCVCVCVYHSSHHILESNRLVATSLISAISGHSCRLIWGAALHRTAIKGQESWRMRRGKTLSLRRHITWRRRALEPVPRRDHRSQWQ